MEIRNITYYQHCTEWQVFDRKSVRIKPRDLAELIVAFANADGGVVAIGIENNGDISGVDQHLDKLNELLRVPQDFCVPSVPVLRSEMIECIDVNGRTNHIVLIEVEASMLLHANQADEVFLRVGDKSKKQTFEQRLQLMYAKGIRYYEISPVLDATIADLDMSVVENYRERIGYTRDSEEMLHSLGFIRKKDGVEQVSVAAILLFAKQPELFFPCARVRVIRYDGTEERTGSRMNVVKDRMFVGRLREVIDLAKDFVKTQLDEHTYLGTDGTFTTEEEYPEFCWTELLVNACGHRDYSILGTDIQVKIFTDHLTVESPGVLPGMVRVSNIRDEHFSRNPKIMAYLKAYGLVKEYGEGVNRMFDEMQAAGKPAPEFVVSDFMVRATLLPAKRMLTDKTMLSNDGTFAPNDGTFAPDDSTFAPNATIIYTEWFDRHIAPHFKLLKSKTKAANDCWVILQLMQQNPRISLSQIAENKNISLRTIKTYVKYMQNAGMLKYYMGEWNVNLLAEKDM